MADESNILSGGIAELEQMKEKIIHRNEGKVRIAELTDERDRLSKEIKIKEKLFEDEVSSTHKRRKEEISITYDNEWNKISQNLKKAKDKKDKLKTQKVSERMKEQTSGDVFERDKLKQNIKELFKQNRVPSIFNNKLYYALISPATVTDILVVLLSILVVLLIIPCGIYLCIPDKKTWYLIVLYMITVILFGAPYLYIYGRSKDKYWATIQSAKAIRTQIRAISKKIRITEKGIKKDKDESTYGLEQCDAEIAEVEQQLNDVIASKGQALAMYDNEAAIAVTAEIGNRYQPDLDSLKTLYQNAGEEKKHLAQENKELNLEMANTYEAYLGKEFVSVDKADQLIEIFQTKGAANISDAIQKYRQGDSI